MNVGQKDYLCYIKVQSSFYSNVVLEIVMILVRRFV